jgi:hypothetical protein
MIAESTEQQSYYSLYTVYNAIEEINNIRNQVNKGVNEKDILKISIITSYKNVHENSQFANNYLIVECVESINQILANLQNYVNTGFLKHSNKKYYIQEEHEQYKLYKLNFLKISKITDHSIQFVNSMNTMIDDLTNGFSISSSDNDLPDEETENTNTMEEEKVDQEESYYVIKSSDQKSFYLISKDLKTCTCKGFEFSRYQIKTCRHLNEIQEIPENNRIFITTHNNIYTNCTCNYYAENEYCQHTSYLNA